MIRRSLIVSLFVFAVHSQARPNTAEPLWRNGDNECPAASATDRYVDAPVFHDLESVARVDRIPGLNVFKELQTVYKDKKIRVYYELFRPWDPAKKLLIVIPGGPGQTHADLHPLVDLFEKTDLLKKFNVIAMDHRGVGCSRPKFPGNEPAESMMMRQAASDIDLIRKELVGSHGRISVWGYSYGSILAQTYALLYPDHIDRFSIGGAVSKMDDFHLVGVLLESLVFSVVDNGSREQLEQLWQNDIELKNAFIGWAFGPLYSYKGRVEVIPAKVKEVIEKVKAGEKAQVLQGMKDGTREITPWMMRSIACLEIFPYTTKYEGEFPIWQMAMGFCSEFQGKHEYFNYTPLLKQITAPTFIYGGAFDHVTPGRAMIEIAREIPGSFLFLDNFTAHSFRGKSDCFVALTSKFFLGASNQELQETSYTPTCQRAPVDE